MIGAVIIGLVWSLFAYAIASMTDFWFLGIPSIGWGLILFFAGLAVAGWYATNQPDQIMG